MATIDTLDPLVPADALPVADVPDAIRDLVVALQTTFPNLVGVSGLAELANFAITWHANLSAVTAYVHTHWDGTVTFNLAATINQAFVTGTDGTNFVVSSTDVTAISPPGAGLVVPNLTVWGRRSGRSYYELMGYLTLNTTSGIVCVFNASAPTGTYDRMRVLGAYNVAA